MAENKLSPEAQALLNQLKKDPSTAQAADQGSWSFFFKTGTKDGLANASEISKAVENEDLSFNPRPDSEIARRYPLAGQMGDLINEIGRVHPEYVDRDVTEEYDRNAQLNLTAINPKYAELLEQLSNVTSEQQAEKGTETNPVALAQNAEQNPAARGA